jgi:hypothetical protein
MNTIDDFIEDLKKRIHQRWTKEDGSSGIGITAKQKRAIRQQALDHWKFETLRKEPQTKHSGSGDEHTGEFREFHFGDGLERISNRKSA